MRLGIDLGGTTVGIGIVGDSFQIVYSESHRTAGITNPELLVTVLLASIDHTIGNSGHRLDEISFIGMGCPGEVDPVKGIGVHADNLAVENTDFRSILTARYGKPFQIDNDANCAAWGEHIAGSSVGKNNVVTVTLGTGVGGGVIIDGKILHGNENHGGEVGHMVIDMNGKRCGCGRVGCWETVASTRALIADTERQVQLYPDSYLAELARMNGGHAGGRTLFQALSKHDEAAQMVFDRWIHYLEIGMWNIINIFRPEMIVISGGISEQGDVFIQPLRDAVGPCSTVICAGKLGGSAGLIGASALNVMNY